MHSCPSRRWLTVNVSPGHRRSGATETEVAGAGVEELGCARLRLCVGLLGYGHAMVLQLVSGACMTRDGRMLGLRRLLWVLSGAAEWPRGVGGCRECDK